MKKVISLTWGVLNTREKRSLMLLSTLNVVCAGLDLVGLGLFVPFLAMLTDENSLGNAVRGFFEGKDDKEIIIISMVWICLAFILKNLTQAWALWLQKGFLANLRARLTQRLFEYYMTRPLSYHLEVNSSLAMRNMYSGAVAVVGSGAQPILMMMSDAILSIAILGLFLFFQPLVFAVTLSVVLIMGGSALFLSKSRLYGAAGRLAESQWQELHNFNQGIDAATEIKLFKKEAEFSSKFAEANKRFAKEWRLVSTIQSLPRMWFELGFVIAFSVGVIVMLSLGSTTDRIIIGAGVIAVAALRLLPSGTRILSSLQSLQTAAPVVEIIEEELETISVNGPNCHSFIKSTEDRLILKKEISVQNLTFAYSDGREIIKSAFFSIKKNESVGIVGPSGEGKSTLINLLIGILEPIEGRVMVDNENIHDLPGRWHSSIGVVPQQVYLIDDTIIQNVAFGVNGKDIDMGRVVQSIEDSGLEQDIMAFPEGLKTRVGQRGARLSGGQRQRLGIARALYTDPSVLILDEATSSLDFDTERKILQTVDSMHGEKTLIIVSHRKSALIHCDRVLRVGGGKITEISNYEG